MLLPTFPLDAFLIFALISTTTTYPLHLHLHLLRAANLGCIPSLPTFPMTTNLFLFLLPSFLASISVLAPSLSVNRHPHSPFVVLPLIALPPSSALTHTLQVLQLPEHRTLSATLCTLTQKTSKSVSARYSSRPLLLLPFFHLLAFLRFQKTLMQKNMNQKRRLSWHPSPAVCTLPPRSISAPVAKTRTLVHRSILARTTRMRMFPLVCRPRLPTPAHPTRAHTCLLQLSRSANYPRLP